MSKYCTSRSLIVGPRHLRFSRWYTLSKESTLYIRYYVGDAEGNYSQSYVEYNKQQERYKGRPVRYKFPPSEDETDVATDKETVRDFYSNDKISSGGRKR